MRIELFLKKDLDPMSHGFTFVGEEKSDVTFRGLYDHSISLAQRIHRVGVEEW